MRESVWIFFIFTFSLFLIRHMQPHFGNKLKTWSKYFNEESRKPKSKLLLSISLDFRRLTHNTSQLHHTYELNWSELITVLYCWWIDQFCVCWSSYEIRVYLLWPSLAVVVSHGLLLLCCLIPLRFTASRTWRNRMQCNLKLAWWNDDSLSCLANVCYIYFNRRTFHSLFLVVPQYTCTPRCILCGKKLCIWKWFIKSSLQ